MERREKGGERGREEGKRTRTGGNGVETGRARELRGLRWGGNRGWGDWEEGGYSDKAEGSAGCVEFLGIKEDFCNITNCERKMAEKLRRFGGGKRDARSCSETIN